MAPVLRPYEARDFPALYRLDQACFPAGIAYTKTGLRYFLNLNGAQCLVAEENERIAGFLLAEENAPLAHIITLDLPAPHGRWGIGSERLRQTATHLPARGARSILLESATATSGAAAFRQPQGHRLE